METVGGVGRVCSAVFFFLFNSALIPAVVGTMTVGGVLVLGYEQLLTRWAKKGFSDIQRLGLIMGGLGFWTLFWGPLLEFLGRLGTSVLGLMFVVYLTSLRRKLLQIPVNSSVMMIGTGPSNQPEPIAR